MIFFALPVAGQGLLGKRAAASAWYEQLVLHAVFGTLLWAGLGLFQAQPYMKFPRIQLSDKGGRSS